jgi:hypothetical protein
MNQKYSKNLSMRQNRLLEKVNKLQARIQKKLDNSQFVKLAKRKQQLETKYYYENYLKHWSIALASIIVLFLSPIVVQAQNALDFDGTNDYVNFGDVDALDGLSAVTLECWVKLNSTSGRIIIKEVNGSPTDGWGFKTTSSGQIIGFARNGVDAAGVTPFNSISAGVWTHIAYVFDGSGSSNLERLKIYINGIEQTLTYAGTIPSTLSSNSSNFVFGSTSDLTTDFFNGTLDEVRIWTTARTEADILNNKNCELVGNESGLFGYYDFNQGTAGGSNSGTTTLTDLTSNGNNGTLGNFALTGSTSNWVANTITPPPALSVTIVSDDADNSIVSGTSVTFTATPTNGGSTPFYQWKKNGVNVGTDSDTYTDAALVDNDVITVEMTNEITCAAVAISSDITMTVSPVLPVELTSFTATVQDNQTNLLQWQTATEENNEGFEVERSAEGSNWEKLGFVQGQGTTLETQNYTFVDEEPTRGINYYRLKQMDFDGQFEYSNIRSVVFGSSDDKIMAIYPNPVQNELTISEGVGMITIFNALGQPIRQLNNDETLTIINTTDLPKGIYILQVQKTNGAIITQQFVK